MHQIGMFARHFVVVIEFFYIDYTTNLLKTLFLKIKALQQNAKGLGIVWLPLLETFRTFCMADEIGKVYQKLEEVISVC